jgi:hypothetical protein
MELNEPGIRVDADPELWIPVPLAFPSGEWADLDAWVATVAAAITDGIDAGDEVKRQLWALTRDIAEMEPPEASAIARFWYFPRSGGGMQLAHLYLAFRDEVGDVPLEELGLRSSFELLPQRVDPVGSDNVDAALRIVAVGIARDGRRTVDVSLARYVGERHGVIAVLEVIDTRLEPIAEILEPLGVLFSGVTWSPPLAAAPDA